MVITKKRRFVGYTGILAVVGGLSLAACNIILNIGEATHDPTLDDGGGGTDAGDGASPDDCNTYCSLVAGACTGTNAEYLSNDVCQAMCATFDPGQPGDTTGDSLSCRIHYAKMAASDPLTYCQKAGPLAGGSCTDPCHSFCVLAYGLCNADMLFLYDGGSKGCESACASYTYLLSSSDAGAGDAGDAGGPVGDILFLSGDTLNCRLYHLESAFNAAIPNAVKIHCPHTASDSATCN